MFMIKKRPQDYFNELNIIMSDLFRFTCREVVL